MIVHLLLCQARDTLTSTEERELEDVLASLASVPGVQSFTWGRDFSGRGKGYTHAAVMHFVDHSALEAYQTNERHVRVVERLANLLDDKLVIDYDTETSGITN